MPKGRVAQGVAHRSLRGAPFGAHCELRVALRDRCVTMGPLRGWARGVPCLFASKWLKSSRETV
jgi:hypothetical protein